MKGNATLGLAALDGTARARWGDDSVSPPSASGPGRAVTELLLDPDPVTKDTSLAWRVDEAKPTKILGSRAAGPSTPTSDSQPTVRADLLAITRKLAALYPRQFGGGGTVKGASA